MNQDKADWLKVVIGDELAGKVIHMADTATKDLEGQVAFKDSDSLKAAMGAMRAALSDASPEVKSAWADFLKSVSSSKGKADDDKEDDETKDEAETKDDDAETKAEASSEKKADLDIVSTLKDMLAPLGEALGVLRSELAAERKERATETAAIAERTLNLEQAKAQKEADATPRGASVYRATEDVNNILDATKAKDILGENDSPVSPARAYVEDLLRSRPNA